MNLDYFHFLCQLVDLRTEHLCLLGKFHSMEFYGFVQNDENRVLGGLKLRELYCIERLGLNPEEVPNGASKVLAKDIEKLNRDFDFNGCTVLEMMIALSYRIEDSLIDIADGHDMPFVFWMLVQNLDLMWADDVAFVEDDAEELVESVILRLVERKYRPDGRGGLFPLRKTKKDQRCIELWYQMCEWLLEKMPPP